MKGQSLDPTSRWLGSDHLLALGPTTQGQSFGFSWVVHPPRIKMDWGTFTGGPALI